MQILTYPTLSISPEILAEVMKSLCKEKITVVTNTNKITEHFIRYGNSSTVETGLDLETNTQSFIRLAGNKLSFSKIIALNRFHCPKFYTRDFIPGENQYPILIRSTLYGKRGEGITVVKNKDKFLEHIKVNYHWTPFVKTEFELRVHIAGGKILRVFKKVFTENEEEEYPIRNMMNGYHFSLRENIENYPKVIEIVNKLWQIPIFKGQFLSLDVGWDKEKKEYFIFEGNTSPGLNDNTALEYGKFLVEKLGL